MRRETIVRLREAEQLALELETREEEEKQQQHERRWRPSRRAGAKRVHPRQLVEHVEEAREMRPPRKFAVLYHFIKVVSRYCMYWDMHTINTTYNILEAKREPTFGSK